MGFGLFPFSIFYFHQGSQVSFRDGSIRFSFIKYHSNALGMDAANPHTRVLTFCSPSLLSPLCYTQYTRTNYTITRKILHCICI